MQPRLTGCLPSLQTNSSPLRRAVWAREKEQTRLRRLLQPCEQQYRHEQRTHCMPPGQTGQGMDMAACCHCTMAGSCNIGREEEDVYGARVVLRAARASIHCQTVTIALDTIARYAPPLLPRAFCASVLHAALTATCAGHRKLCRAAAPISACARRTRINLNTNAARTRCGNNIAPHTLCAPLACTPLCAAAYTHQLFAHLRTVTSLYLAFDTHTCLAPTPRIAFSPHCTQAEGKNAAASAYARAKQ